MNMFSRKDKAVNNAVKGNELEKNEVKPRRSSRLSMISNNENQATSILKDGQEKHILGLAARRPRPLINKKNLPDSAASIISDKPVSTLFVSKPYSFHDLRFGGGSTMVSVDFAEDIDQYLRYLEKVRRVDPDFLHGKKVDGRMRQILVDWLMQVQLRFQLCSETLQLSIATLDRALCRMDVSKDNLQLLGVSCMFIASKFEEIYVPNIQDFVYIAANIFTKKDVLRMEHLILHALEFQLSIPYTIQFLRKYRALMKSDNSTHNLAKFIAEIALLDYSLTHLNPSKVASVAVYLASKILQIELPLGMFEAMEITESELIALSKKFVPAMQHWIGSEMKLLSLKNKFDKLYPNVKPTGLSNLEVFTELTSVLEEFEV